MRTEERDSPRLFDGSRILDLDPLLFGPCATQVPGHPVAEILGRKPKAGHDLRHLPPYFVGEDAAYFLSANLNNKSILIDTKTLGRLSLLGKLIAECDVVFENHRTSCPPNLRAGTISGFESALRLDDAEPSLLAKVGAIAERKSSTMMSAA